MYNSNSIYQIFVTFNVILRAYNYLRGTAFFTFDWAIDHRNGSFIISLKLPSNFVQNKKIFFLDQLTRLFMFCIIRRR